MDMYRHITYQWRRLFGYYDLVQAYATDPILPMLAGKQPYIGFEHGTLRSHTLRDEAVCRLTSLAYNMADHVFVTNGDCLEYARKIGVTRYTPMLHPVDERRIAQIEGRYDELRRELGVRHVFLCTLRHDWAIKGTDQYIRALPELTRSLGRDFRVIMTRWGADLEKSIALAESLGVADLIVWSEPLSRRKLIQTLKSVDVLFDQIALPHFGATAPEGIAAGIPVIMSYEPASTEWLVAEPAPILAAHNAAEIAAQVSCALDPEWLNDYRQRAAKWFDAHHSSHLVVQGHMDAYRRLIPIDRPIPNS
jgi:glycosyltransferase involved in cell wall biosynthesis